jgi:hypothetical protein
VCVLEYGYRDVIDNFDHVAGELSVALVGGKTDPELDLGSLPGWQLKDQDFTTHRAVLLVDPEAWVGSEAKRIESLHSANRARLAGWRLRRIAQ